MQSWRDIHDDVWTMGDDGLLHTPETRAFPLEYVEKKWGPLLAVESSETAPDVQPDGIAPVSPAAVLRAMADKIDEGTRDWYGVDLFRPPSAEDLEAVDELMRSRGRSLDAISGELYRRSRSAVAEDIRRAANTWGES